MKAIPTSLMRAAPHGMPSSRSQNALPQLPHEIGRRSVPNAAGIIHRIGESEFEVLNWVPSQLRMVRITRQKYACRICNKVAQVAAPERPIASGLAIPALLAHVLVSIYCDHTPIYRQAQIFAHHGVEIERSTLCCWVGSACCDSKRCMSDCAGICLLPTISSPTTYPFQYLILEVGAQRPSGDLPLQGDPV